MFGQLDEVLYFVDWMHAIVECKYFLFASKFTIEVESIFVFYETKIVA